jgi:hypothetical protein
MSIDRVGYRRLVEEVESNQEFNRAFNDIAKSKLLDRWDSAVSAFRRGERNKDAITWSLVTGCGEPSDTAWGE